MKIIASEFTQEQAEAFIKEIGKKSAADLFDSYLRGECTQGELRGWLMFIDQQRGLSNPKTKTEDRCTCGQHDSDTLAWYGDMCPKHGKRKDIY